MSEFTDQLRAIRERTKRIKDTFSNTGTIEASDLDFLCEKAVKELIISSIADNDWARWRVDILTKDMEIEELKRQLREKNG